MLDSDRGIKGFDINDWPCQFRLGFIAKFAGRPLKELISPLLELAGTSNCRDNSTTGCSLGMAANATFALNAGLGFRHLCRSQADIPIILAVQVFRAPSFCLHENSPWIATKNS